MGPGGWSSTGSRSGIGNSWEPSFVTSNRAAAQLFGSYVLTVWGGMELAHLDLPSRFSKDCRLSVLSVCMQAMQPLGGDLVEGTVQAA